MDNHSGWKETKTAKKATMWVVHQIAGQATKCSTQTFFAKCLPSVAQHTEMFEELLMLLILIDKWLSVLDPDEAVNLMNWMLHW